MFDHSDLDRLYGDPNAAHSALIAALARRALEEICKQSATSGEDKRLACSAPRKAARILRRCPVTRG